MDDGDWPELAAAGAVVELHELIIAGRGGNGGADPNNPNGLKGGTALRTRTPLKLINCIIGGGGGGGGAAVGHLRTSGALAQLVGGGGGAGSKIGIGSSSGAATLYEGGRPAAFNAYPGGQGGSLGLPGMSGYSGATATISFTGHPGGAPGAAIDGFSFCTLENCTIYGPTGN